jgi:hypothetical protein
MLPSQADISDCTLGQEHQGLKVYGMSQKQLGLSCSAQRACSGIVIVVRKALKYACSGIVILVRKALKYGVDSPSKVGCAAQYWWGRSVLTLLHAALDSCWQFKNGVLIPKRNWH